MAAEDYTKVAIALFLCTDESKKPELKKNAEDKLKFLFKRFEKDMLI